MSRYIDADALVKRLKHSPLFLGTQMQFKDGVIDLVERQPTVDVVEVVRCKDCKHYNEYGEDPILERKWGVCRRPLGDDDCCIEVAENDYCSCVERRDENEG